MEGLLAFPLTRQDDMRHRKFLRLLQTLTFGISFVALIGIVHTIVDKLSQ